MSKALFKPGIQITELSLEGLRMTACHQVVIKGACLHIPCYECLLGHENSTKENILQFIAPGVLERFAKPRFQVDLEKYTKLIRDNEESFKKEFGMYGTIASVGFDTNLVRVEMVFGSFFRQHLKDVLEWVDKQ